MYDSYNILLYVIGFSEYFYIRYINLYSYKIVVYL